MNKIFKTNEEPISIRLMRDGEMVKQNMFVTVKGNYRISIVLYQRNLYFVKELDGKVVEAVNLSEKANDLL